MAGSDGSRLLCLCLHLPLPRDLPWTCHVCLSTDFFPLAFPLVSPCFPTLVCLCFPPLHHLLSTVFHHPLSSCLQNITDEDVLALVNDEVHQPTVVWVLEDLQASAGRRRLDWRGRPAAACCTIPAPGDACAWGFAVFCLPCFDVMGCARIVNVRWLLFDF